MTGGKFDYTPAGDLGLPELSRMRSVRREPGLFSYLAHRSTGAAIAAYMRVFHRLALSGVENLPLAPPFVLVSNHTSHLDALILASAVCSRARATLYPLAAGDVFFESTRRSLLASVTLNALPVSRKGVTRHAFEDLRERLQSGTVSYVLFPEGGRSRSGELMTFRAGVGRLVAQTSTPVIPCFISGAHSALAPGRWLPRPTAIRVRVGAPTTFDTIDNDRAGWDSIASALEQRVRALARTASPSPPAPATTAASTAPRS